LLQREKGDTDADRKKDFLDILIETEDEQHGKLSEKSILDNVNTFIFAGQYAPLQ